MKLKKMKKALKNLDKGAVTVIRKDQKYDLSDCPDWWDDRKIVDSYKSEGKNGGVILVVGKKNKEKEKKSGGDSEIDSSIMKMKKDLDNLFNDDEGDSKERHDKHKSSDHKTHDHSERKADELILDTKQQNGRPRGRDNRQNQSNRRNDRSNRQNRLNTRQDETEKDNKED